MKRDRGEYRPIYAALLDGPEYQKLSGDARQLLVILKIKLGAVGIGCVPSFENACVYWAARRLREVRKALAELQEQGWIEVEENVVWLVRGFEFEPSFEPSNINQRKYVQRTLDALPNLPIVQRWKARYAAWVPEGYVPPPSKGLPDPLRSSTTTTTTTPKEQDQKLSGRAKKPRDTTEPSNNWPAEFSEIWVKNIGAMNPGRIGKELKDLVGVHGVDAVRTALVVYAEEGPEKRDVRWFANDYGNWARIAAMPMVAEGGTGFTERALRLWAS